MAKVDSLLTSGTPCDPVWWHITDSRLQAYESIVKKYLAITQPNIKNSEVPNYMNLIYKIDTAYTPTPNGPSCTIAVTTWITHHYEPKNGRAVGIWPLDFSTNNLSTLRNHFGYQNAFVRNGSDYANAIAAGYTPDNIMMSVAFPVGTQDYQSIISTYNAQYYYIDEAVNHACAGNGDKRLYNPTELANVKNYITLHRPGSLFVSSGYKICGHMNTLTSIVNILMYSSYTNWNEWLLPCLNTNMGWGATTESTSWLPGSYDQRDSWDLFKMHYIPQFTMTWIGTWELSEFQDLFAKGNTTGLYSIWIYGYMDNGNPVPHYNDSFYNISDAAWNKGYLRKFVQQVQTIWRCNSPVPCDCDPSCWPQEYIVDSINLGVIEEVFP